MTLTKQSRRQRPEAAKRPHLKRGGFGPARVSLLPAELKREAQERRVRQRMIAAVLIALTVTVTGVGGAGAYAITAQSAADQATMASSAATAQLGRYTEVQALQQRIALSDAAKRVGSSPQIDWQSFLKRIAWSAPQGFTITAITADSASAVAAYPQGATPLDGARVGTVLITAHAASITALPSWLAALSQLRGYADATPSVTAGDGSGYTVSVTMHVTDALYITPLKKGAGS